ncbi:flagellar biosynthesis anti-sigma factor FlgM [Sphingomonas sp. M1-B02]|uniref:flagellar biosynthesis anti-sigma factor FlgM n=1 Tax=Sphingomonas sp. M1-B02 TaxID=3114300 RepID=UPI00223F776E|nr:flagellar biosynthesis anti-sigma factor FlgM [Sphingomonas sp. S6-11]UZK65321.1 flagellar biosynthesis anti-sigma factor FlgM [Sphingomonas sp. S6-11]
MVDPIGNKAGVASARRVASVGAVASVTTLKPAAKEAGLVESSAAQLAGTMASQAPVDAERVSKIRKAIQDGRFPLVPSTVADRLLALKLEWNPNDQA